MDSLEYIDDYFNQKVSPEETRQFEKRIQDDPIFAEEVAWYISSSIVLKEEHAAESIKRFREIHRQTTAEANDRQAKIRKFRPLFAAAAVLAGIALCWYLLFSPVAPSKLADQYIRQNLNSMSVKMGTADSLQTGLTLYNNGKFKEAYQHFVNLFHTDSLNWTAKLNAGITALRMEEFDLALGLFRELQTHTDPHLNPALFYEALTLLKRNRSGDLTHAKRLLQEIVQKDLNKKKDAQELLTKL